MSVIEQSRVQQLEQQLIDAKRVITDLQRQIHDHDTRRVAAMQQAAALAEELKRYEWQPIETAPKDGTEILAHDEDDNVFIAFFCPYIKSWVSNISNAFGQEEHPTHWIPLPEPPK